MELNISKKTNFKDTIISTFKTNKLKVYFFIILLLVSFIALIYLQKYNQEKNKIISEKYIQAGLYLTSDKKDKSLVLYEEIILSKNEFYSILALNSVLENKLVSDKKKILEFFEIVETTNKSKFQRDLLTLKKGLFLLKISKINEGNNLLNSLVKSNSKLKQLAEEALTK